MTEERTRRVSILVFDEVEVLDFCGPFEVFSVTGRRDGLNPFEVETVAVREGPVLARGGLSINPHRRIDDCPSTDILVVPGGYGTRREIHNARVVDWIWQRSGQAELVCSVCTGALLLAVAGVLPGLTATTHRGAVDLLGELAPDTVVDPSRRFVDNGRVILSAGISAGIDMSLHVVTRLLGVEVARETAEYMEYRWNPESEPAET